MATPTLSLATLANNVSPMTNKNGIEIGDKKQRSQQQQQQQNVSKGNQPKPATTIGQSAPTNSTDSPTRRHVTEEVNDDSIYCICLKKITYTFNNSLNKQATNSNYVTRCDQIDSHRPSDKTNSKWYDDQQSLQWETRQLRTIKGATMVHLVQYMLLLTPYQSGGGDAHFGDHMDDDLADVADNVAINCEGNSLLEERNNVAHAMHVIFATYRQFVYPWQLFNELIRQKPFASCKQFNFILYYWLNNYPEDFWTPCQPKNSNNNNNNNNNCINADDENESHKTTMLSNLADNDNESLCSEYTSSSSSSQYQDYTGSSSISSTFGSHSSTSSETFCPLTLADQLISMRNIDEEVKKHCLHLLDMKKENTYSNRTLTFSNHKTLSKTSSILELDSKFIAQQLTAIDLENFLTLKPYTLLSNVRSNTKIEAMIRNFNLLSRHVIITILQHSTPQIVTIHWIEVAHHLRKMRNFNSLKAIIAGLTNESIHRLKITVWNKLPRASMATFTHLSSIVDDVNNQTLLRHTQLFIEGTSKVSLEESFGTVPYLGTFLTDITMINTRYQNYIKMDNGKKLINFEKTCKQYEILMQMQLLQKNAIAALQQQQQQTNYHLGPIYSLNHYLSLRSQVVPSIPRVARIFRNWFQLNETDLPSDRECYQLSLAIEATPVKGKK